jgi:hypothetical protein
VNAQVRQTGLGDLRNARDLADVIVGGRAARNRSGRALRRLQRRGDDLVIEFNDPGMQLEPVGRSMTMVARPDARRPG